MSQSKLEQRYAEIRRLAAQGAEVGTFAAFEQLWNDASAAGETALARRVLRDLALLTAQIDPQVARQLAAASTAGATDGLATADASAAIPAGGSGGPVELSVVVLGVPAPAAASPALESLRAQSIAATRYETILADRDDAASCDAALRAARGEVILFVAHDLRLPSDALRRHLTAHAGGGPRQAVLGAVEWDGLSLRPLAQALDSLGLLGCQAGVEASGEVPPECLTLAHASFPRAALLAAGGVHVGLAAFAGPELGVRLAAAGWRITLDPAIAARRTPVIDLDQWLTRCRAMGGDWTELRRLHGDSAPPTWLRDVGLEEGAQEALLARLLAGADRHSRCVRALRESLHEMEQMLARRPERAAETMAKLLPDLSVTLLQVTRHELMRGFVHSLSGGGRDLLERCAVRTERGAAVIVLANDLCVQAAAIALRELPAWAELLVGLPEGASEPRLPADPRLRRMQLPRVATAPQLKRALLEGTSADFFVLLDGSSVPTRSEWEALRLTLATLPRVGACTVDGEPAALATARACAQLPSALVAVRRDVVEGDCGDAGPLLDRLVRKGYRLATATPAREEAACSR